MIARLFMAFGIVAALAQTAQSATLNFCWVGGGGYTMTGTMVIPDDRMGKAIITQDDVTGFKITGYLNGTQVGSWNMDARGPDTTWHLRFVPQTMTFPTGGSFATLRSQGWNADGTASNCGTPGFGFNSGSAGQDVCIDGTYIRASTIPPPTPFVATFAPVTPDCRQSTPLSKK